jgi:hypothetical protein
MQAFRRPQARAALSLALLGGLFGHGHRATQSGEVVVSQPAIDPYSQAPRGGVRGFVYRVARPVFDSERRSPLLISSYAGRRNPEATTGGLGFGRRKVRAAEFRGPAAGSAGAGGAVVPVDPAAPAGFP